MARHGGWKIMLPKKPQADVGNGGAHVNRRGKLNLFQNETVTSKTTC
jgi:hypothetical protein